VRERCKINVEIHVIQLKSLEGGEITRNNLVDRFMCELIVGVEDLVHFRENNNSMFIFQDKLASNSKLAK
jgi:hypothetical protein